MSKAVKKTVQKLTYYNGRQYAPGETIEFLPEDAEIAAKHYGVKLPTESSEEIQAAKTAAAGRAAKAGAQAGTD